MHVLAWRIRQRDSRYFSIKKMQSGCVPENPRLDAEGAVNATVIEFLNHIRRRVNYVTRERHEHSLTSVPFSVTVTRYMPSSRMEQCSARLRASSAKKNETATVPRVLISASPFAKLRPLDYRGLRNLEIFL